MQLVTISAIGPAEHVRMVHEVHGIDPTPAVPVTTCTKVTTKPGSLVHMVSTCKSRG